MKRSSSFRRKIDASRNARGVILLVMLGMLALFTLIAVTFVVASGQFRRGAAAASKAEQMGDPFETLLQQALMQVARGSNHPQSAIGPHGLLEDMYGNGDAVAGCAFIENSQQGSTPPTFIYALGQQMTLRANRSHPFKGMATAAAPMFIEIGALSFGWDREPGAALVDDDNNGVVDDVSELVSQFGTAVFTAQSDDCFLGSTRAHPAMCGIPPSGNPTSDVADLWQSAWVNKTTPVIDNVENYYAGRVITFVNGDAAGQSSYIVRSKLLPLNPSDSTSTEFRTILFIQPFANGAQPSHKDRFVINGRPFNGAGFGYNPYTANGNSLSAKTPMDPNNPQLPNPALRALDMPYTEPFIRTPGNNGSPYAGDLIRTRGYPIALLPNPADAGYRDYLNRYNSIVDADEDYDAPDEQNMLLSYSVWVPSIDGSSPGRYRTIMPSLHRPDLIKYFTNQPGFPVAKPSEVSFPRWHDVPPQLRRRYILRPDPSDHYDWTQEANASSPAISDGWSPGEPFQDINNNGQWDPVTVVNGAPGPKEPWIDLPTPNIKNGVYDIGDRTYYNTGFDALDGPWDVDNDGDTVPDSIWVDLGAPVTTAPDGRFVKPLFAIMVRDLDGRINVNAHGSQKHYDRLPGAYGAYNAGAKPSPYMTHERVRMGNYAWAMYQFEPDVAWNTVDVIRTHTAGEPEAKRDALTFGDVPFTGLWALPYFGDAPTRASLKIPGNATSGHRPLMFDIQGAQTSGTYDRTKHIRGFEPAVGQGWSVADVNLGQVLHSSIWGMAQLPNSNSSSGSTIYYSYNYYRVLLEGLGSSNGTSFTTPGRYGEGFLVGSYGLGGVYPGVVGPRAGVTDQVLNGVAAANPGPQPPLRGDDDYPAAPFRFKLPSADARFVRGNQGRESFMPDNTGKPSINGAIVGDFGTPADHDSDGFLALDISGQPVFHKMGTAYEELDSPNEINLHRRYFAQTYFGLNGSLQTPAGVPYTTDIDAPYTPAEMERLLRGQDSGADVLPARLTSLLRGDVNNSGELDTYDLRRAITTESWDIPCPHIAPTPELAAALRMLNLPLNNPTLGDLLRARFFLAKGQAAATPQDALNAARLATVAMRSYRWRSIPADSQTLGASASPDEKAQFPSNKRLTTDARKRGHTRLLSPDLGLGLRMDVNAPFGNGYDDNNNGVVDEPMEYTASVASNGAVYDVFNFDGNRDGNYDQSIDEEARQQFAKELYCLMMLLIDQNYVQPLPTSISSASTAAAVQGAENPATTFPQMNAAFLCFPYIVGADAPTTAKLKTRRWLLARRMAQWAINAVDFRDRDAIMTPFEFDADPFFDNDVDVTPGNLLAHYPNNCNGTWDVDGYLIVDPLASYDDTTRPWRGVVWGCEYPDLLITETAAFHDRRTQNLMSPPMGQTNYLRFDVEPNALSVGNGVATTETDPHWDSRRVPQGTALFELYATGNPNNPALPRELYYNDGNNLYLDLARTASGPTDPTVYPVWRLAITESHYQNGVSTPVTNTADPHLSPADRIREWPATCSLELSDPGMSLLSSTSFSNVSNLPVPVERIICFSNSTVVTQAAVKAGLTNSSKIEVYYNSTAGYLPRVLPGDYVVVGPARATVSGPRNITMIGQTKKKMVTTIAGGTVTITNYSQPQSIIDMGDPTTGRLFLHSSVNGVDEYPIRAVGATNQYASGHPLYGLVRPTTSLVTPASILDIPNFRQIRPPVSIPCSLTFGTRVVGLNISEPLTTGTLYYPAPDDDNADEWLPSLVVKDGYKLVRNWPLDQDTEGDGDGAHPNENIPTSTPISPFTANINDQTLLNFKTVFLQRLADPTRGWHRLLNPYLTMDWMPIDLTTFNGEPHYTYEDPPGAGTTKKDLTRAVQLDDPSTTRRWKLTGGAAPLVPANVIRFGSRQRGAPRSPFHGNYSFFDLWSQPDWLDTSPDFDTRPPVTDMVKNSPVKIFWSTTAITTNPGYYKVDDIRWQDPFDHTFGYLNLGYHANRGILGTTAASLPVQKSPDWVQSAGQLPDGQRPWLRMSPVREPLRRPAGNAGNLTGWFTENDVGSTTIYGNAPRYVGAPRRAFNWLTWNNRPFAGAMELMLVPASSPGRLLHEYSMRRTILPAVPDSGATTPTALYVNRYTPFSGKRSANHYMPPVPAALGSITSGHPAGSPNSNYKGNFEAGYLVTPPYNHLLNFFESANAVGTELPTGATFNSQQSLAANHFRLFEFVTVPSRFSGTQQMHFATGSSFYNQPLSAALSTMPGGLGTQFEHYGWPFTAPYNKISMYREPGKININTIIPLGTRSFSRTESSSNVNYFSSVVRNERMRDDGAGIWGSVVNDFHPIIRWLAGNDIFDGLGGSNPGSSANGQTGKNMAMQRQSSTSIRSGKTGVRAGPTLSWDAVSGQFVPSSPGMTTANDVTFQPYFFNPSEDYASNFYSAFASMFKDDPNSDPRGPNGVYENWQYWNKTTGAVYSDDRFGHPFWNYGSPVNWARHDGARPSMFTNPFRSFMADYSATPQSPQNLSNPPIPAGGPLAHLNKRYSSSNNPLLAVDATLLRRRDTSWNPWNPAWLPYPANTSDQGGITGTAPSTATSKLYSPAQIDPKFDPLFTLNYPAPFRQPLFDTQYMPGDAGTNKPAWWQFSGYSSPAFNYVGGPTATTFTSYGGNPAVSVDNVRIKDSDYRNTDRNPFFRYQLYTKLSNTITTRSNVYAIWVTVGYFECERTAPGVEYPVQTGHNQSNEFRAKHRYPDGFRILRELGSDNGEAQRHRAFAILDRTIPVGFLRGENLNVDRAFLIRRIVD